MWWCFFLASRTFMNLLFRKMILIVPEVRPELVTSFNKLWRHAFCVVSLLLVTSNLFLFGSSFLFLIYLAVQYLPLYFALRGFTVLYGHLPLFLAYSVVKLFLRLARHLWRDHTFPCPHSGCFYKYLVNTFIC